MAIETFFQNYNMKKKEKQSEDIKNSGMLYQHHSLCISFRVKNYKKE